MELFSTTLLQFLLLFFDQSSKFDQKLFDYSQYFFTILCTQLYTLIQFLQRAKSKITCQLNQIRNNWLKCLFATWPKNKRLYWIQNRLFKVEIVTFSTQFSRYFITENLKIAHQSYAVLHRLNLYYFQKLLTLFCAGLLKTIRVCTV